MEVKSKTSRYEILDGLRGIAAISVMVYHFCQTTKSSQLFENAPLAVDMFFMLSGFVLFHSYSSKLQTGNLRPWAFLKKRAVRLYPMFLMGVILGSGCLVLYPYFPATYIELLVTTVLNAMFIPAPMDLSGQGGGRSVLFTGNGPLWSIFFEMVASIAFLMLFRLETKRLAQIAGIFLLAYVGHTITMAYLDGRMYLDFGNNGWGVKNFLGGFARVGYGFCLGMLIYIGLPKFQSLSLTLKWQRMPYQGILLFLGSLMIFSCPFWVKGLYAFSAITVGLPLLIIAGAVSSCRSKIELSISRTLGDISFPLYCIHMPVILFSKGVLSENNPNIFYSLTTVIISSVITLGLSMALLRIYDEPLRKNMTKKFCK